MNHRKGDLFYGYILILLGVALLVGCAHKPCTEEVELYHGVIPGVVMSTTVYEVDCQTGKRLRILNEQSNG